MRGIMLYAGIINFEYYQSWINIILGKKDHVTLFKYGSLNLSTAFLASFYVIYDYRIRLSWPIIHFWDLW